MKRVSITILAIALAAASQAQVFAAGNVEDENIVQGLGAVVDQSFNGSFSVPGVNAGTVNGSFAYYGTYLNPRTDESAFTNDGYVLPFTTLAQPVEVTSIGINVSAGSLINSGGLAGGTSPTSSDKFNAGIYEVLGDGELISTGETVTFGNLTQTGQGVSQVLGGGSSLYQSFILRPRTDYIFVISLGCNMTFTGTASVPSMGVTQEFNQSAPPIQADFTYQALPEPPQYLGVGLGIVGLAALRRRRRN